MLAIHNNIAEVFLTVADEEIYERVLDIVLQALDKMPDGPIQTKVPKRIKPPKGEVYHVNEGPRGELGVYLISDGSESAYRCRFRSPCFVNLQADDIPVQ